MHWRYWYWLSRWRWCYGFLGLGVPTSQAFIPVDVILIIMSVITAIAAMQVAGGMDWLVQIAENFLRKKSTTHYVLCTNRYFHHDVDGRYRTYSVPQPSPGSLKVKGQGVRPSRPLSLQLSYHKSLSRLPTLCVAVVAFAAMLTPFGVDYLTLLAVCIPKQRLRGLYGCTCSNFMGGELKMILFTKTV